MSFGSRTATHVIWEAIRDARRGKKDAVLFLSATTGKWADALEMWCEAAEIRPEKVRALWREVRLPNKTKPGSADPEPPAGVCPNGHDLSETAFRKVDKRRTAGFTWSCRECERARRRRETARKREQRAN